VYLEVLPQTHIERVALDAKANGDFAIQVFSNAAASQTVEAQVFDLKGKPVEQSFTLLAGDSMLRHHFTSIKTWNAEQPNLYNVVISIKEGNKILHSIKQRFGFRTAELRPQDGFYVNGVKVIFKGVCRHSEWPETGRTLSRKVHLMDIAAIKDMNMNAVRMSHYPPDKEFLDLCDSLGLFVLDELTGWQKSYDTVTARRLVKELIVRDVNHPSIVIWDNGNEGGWNRGVDNDYALYDPQKRHVIHPWERFNGTNTKHYPDYKYVQNEVQNPKEVFFPTEFMHGLFDGGHGAALEDFWNEMMKHPYFAGGFLWVLHDEGVMRKDNKDSMDVAGNQAPDGIVGPHREKEGSYYTIKELWSPVQIALDKLPENFDGKLPVENRYTYTNLNKCSFKWQLIRFPSAAQKTGAVIISKGTVAPLSLSPNQKGILDLKLDNNFSKADALSVTAYDAAGKEIVTRSWAITNPEQIAGKAAVQKTSAISTKDGGTIFTVTCDAVTYIFEKQTGFLQKVTKDQKSISLSEGPSLAGAKLSLTEFKTYKEGNGYIVEPVYDASDKFKIKWTFKKDNLPRLDYQYSIDTASDYSGITFFYPEEKINAMRWLGRGPYHVWKNRLKGNQLNVWQKKYNNTITGESWNYPEFKGWHSQLYWVTVQNKESDFTVYTANDNIFFQMLQPAKQIGIKNNNTLPPFPGNTLGFFNGISAIGTKFQEAKVMGPQSQLNEANTGVPTTGTLYFNFK
jgi:Glycosyl hydrolases family 2, TIM barrel domain/Glycosyl hydrolases family 2/Beta galactosidase small chain